VSKILASRARVDVIHLTGELDLVTAAMLRTKLMTAAETCTAAVLVLDLSQVGFLDAQSAGIITAAGEVARRRGTRLRVVGLHGTPKLVFDLLGLREESG